MLARASQKRSMFFLKEVPEQLNKEKVIPINVKGLVEFCLEFSELFAYSQNFWLR